jgi:hypothetical protein
MIQKAHLAAVAEPSSTIGGMIDRIMPRVS